MPEYGLGLTVLVGCEQSCSDLLNAIQEGVTVNLVQAAEKAIWKDIDRRYSGTYSSVDSNLNSSLSLASSPSKGLVLTSFISNGTDVLNSVIPKLFVDDTKLWHIQLVPTLLFKNESKQEGEIWRMISAYERVDDVDRGVWDEFCNTDVDINLYLGLPVNEVVFWHDKGIVELPAWKVEMKALSSGNDTWRVIVQD